MDPYQALQREAAKKRDAGLRRVRQEYQDALQRIYNLRDLLGESPASAKTPRLKPIGELVCELMPKDRGFTFGDVLRTLREAEPTREFNDPSIRSILAVLDKKGKLKRVSMTQNGRVLWAMADAEIEVSEFGQVALVDVAESMLQKHGPMRPAELVVAIRETGYRADADPHATMAAVRQLLRRHTARFKQGEDGRWGVANL
jgi:hypothetical protein